MNEAVNKKDIGRIANNPEIQKSFNELRRSINNGVRNDPLDKINLYRQGLEDKSRHAQIESVEILKNIEANTEYLKTMIELVHENNTNQEEILNTIKQILDIASASNKQEVESKYKKIMRNISDAAETGANLATLTQLATTVYQFVLKLL